MAGRHYYYLLTSLPTLGELGSRPPLSPADFVQRVRESDGPVEPVEALLLSDDLLRRQGVLAGEVAPEEVEPVVLTAGQARDDAPLPQYLVPDAPQPRAGAVPGDAVWAAYFRYAASVAVEHANGFLAAWVRHEVGLRNAVAAHRAKALGLEPTEYLVAEELGDGEGDYARAVNDWASAGDPLSALRALDRARWEWIAANDGHFSFGDDEPAAYAAKLMLLGRWDRLSNETKSNDRNR